MAATLTRLEKLLNRRLDPTIKVGEVNEAYKRLTAEGSAVQYAIGAMQPIDPDYTKRTIEQRNRVERQLSDGYAAAGLGVDFDYQGSVTNDTHIRAHSDVDLLTVERRFSVVQPPNSALPMYQGDSIEDLRELRKSAASTLRVAYPTAKVDETGSKAINVSGGSLRRKVDVIACAWWRTVEYVKDPQKHWLGIVLLDNEKGERVPNKPFLHNKRIEDQDVITKGGLRKVIRLLKSLKYDSDDKISISSYDVAGIVYNIFDDWLTPRPGADLALVESCRKYLNYLLYDKTYRETLEVPNKSRRVFCEDGADETGLRELSMALDMLVREIEQGLSKSFRKLEEARINY
jgi:hypothetical protein